MGCPRDASSLRQDNRRPAGYRKNRRVGERLVRGTQEKDRYEWKKTGSQTRGSIQELVKKRGGIENRRQKDEGGSIHFPG